MAFKRIDIYLYKGISFLLVFLSHSNPLSMLIRYLHLFTRFLTVIWSCWHTRNPVESFFAERTGVFALSKRCSYFCPSGNAGDTEDMGAFIKTTLDGDGIKANGALSASFLVSSLHFELYNIR